MTTTPVIENLGVREQSVELYVHMELAGVPVSVSGTYISTLTVTTQAASVTVMISQQSMTSRIIAKKWNGIMAKPTMQSKRP